MSLGPVPQTAWSELVVSVVLPFHVQFPASAPDELPELELLLAPLLLLLLLEPLLPTPLLLEPPLLELLLPLLEEAPLLEPLLPLELLVGPPSSPGLEPLLELEHAPPTDAARVIAKREATGATREREAKGCLGITPH